MWCGKFIYIFLIALWGKGEGRDGGGEVAWGLQVRETMQVQQEEIIHDVLGWKSIEKKVSACKTNVYSSCEVHKLEVVQMLFLFHQSASFITLLHMM